MTKLALFSALAAAALLSTAYADAPKSEASGGATAQSDPLDNPRVDDNPSVPGRTHESFSFQELDLNDDGKLMRSESAFRKNLWDSFAKADKDANGSLSQAEYSAWSSGKRSN